MCEDCCRIDSTGEPVIGVEPEIDLGMHGFNSIEAGVKRLVQVLWEKGFRTVCSCAGHLSGLQPHPWVVISFSPEDSHQRFFELFEVIGAFNLNMGKDGKLPEDRDTWNIIPQKLPSGLRENAFAFYLQPSDLNMTGDRARLLELRRQGNRLALFIKENLPLSNA